jgi:hypothetical protein
MIKINTNFEEIDLRDDEQTTVSNLGDTGEGLFAQKLIYDLQFKKLSAGANITLTADLEKIVIAADSGVSDLTITADTGNVVLDNSAALTVSGGADISTVIVGGVLTVAYTGVTDLVSDTTPQLSADLDAQANNLLNVGTIATSGITGPLIGNVTGLVHGIDIRTIAGNDQADFGAINPVIENLLQYVIINTDIDWESIVTPNTGIFDLGAIAV